MAHAVRTHACVVRLAARRGLNMGGVWGGRDSWHSWHSKERDGIDGLAQLQPTPAPAACGAGRTHGGPLLLSPQRGIFPVGFALPLLSGVCAWLLPFRQKMKNMAFLFFVAAPVCQKQPPHALGLTRGCPLLPWHGAGFTFRFDMYAGRQRCVRVALCNAVRALGAWPLPRGREGFLFRSRARALSLACPQRTIRTCLAMPILSIKQNGTHSYRQGAALFGLGRHGSRDKRYCGQRTCVSNERGSLCLDRQCKVSLEGGTGNGTMP